jgi:predicted O-methyltransferase YrrM
LLRKVGDVPFPSTIYLTDTHADGSGDPALHRLAQRENNVPPTQNARRKAMSTLTQPALSMLIDRLFAEADAAENERWPVTRASDRGDYRQYYGLLKDQPLPVSRATGRLLYMLARSVRARTIVEFGTSFGISTLHLAAALRDNGGGRLIGSEFEPSKIARARANLGAADLSDLVEIREGDAVQTLGRDLPDLVDFVLLDGAKGLYFPILSLCVPSSKLKIIFTVT